MDPVVTSIVIILGKYALDKGAELGKAVGPRALDTAKEMFEMVLDRVRRVDPRTADKFAENPAGYQTPMEHVLHETVEADPDFAVEMKALLKDYERAKEEYVAASGPSYDATLEGSGAIAQGEGAVAAGERGVAIGGSGSGTVVTGDGNVIGDHSSGRVQKGGIHADRIEAENVVDGVQMQGGTPVDADQLIELAQAIRRGGITAAEIRAGSVVSGLQFLTGAPPESPADLQREVAALRRQVAQAVVDGEIASAGDAEDVTDALDKAEEELSKPDPEGRRVVRKLETAAEILTGTAETARAARNVGLEVIRLAPVAAALVQLAHAIF
jgi:hypothetical protein